MFKRLRKAVHPVLVFLLFMIAANLGYAKIHKWVDEDGKVHFSDRENQQIADGVNNVYEFFDRVMSFDMYRTVPVNILILKDRTEYRNYLVRKKKSMAVASFGFLLSKPTRRNFVVRLMHNFNRGDRTLAYYLVDDNYIGGVNMLDLDWRRWLHQQGKGIIRL